MRVWTAEEIVELEKINVELLEACKEASQEFEQLGSECVGLRQRLKKAINKAEGR